MSAYAEDAYGKSGFFIVFFLYFISLAIGNVAIAISALGYLSSFFPLLSSTPISTCIGVIALLWLTTVANFGGPSVTGKIGSITVWGVIIPVAGLSIIGWLWFSSETFNAAWNPNGLSLGEGMTVIVFFTLSPTAGEAFTVLADISVLLVLTPYIFAAVSVSYYVQRGMVARSFVLVALLTIVYCLAVIIVSAGTAVAISMALGLATAPLFRAFLAFSKGDPEAKLR